MEHIVILVGSLGIVAYMYSQMPDEKDQSDAWKDGYTAGFLTPGPFTIIGIFGLGYLALKK